MTPRALRTPLLQHDECIRLKPENRQPFGSYKIRGVEAAFAQASPFLLANGVAAASAGNMAQPVAHFARERGLECRIYLPRTAPEIKKQAIRDLGASVIELPFERVWDLVKNGAPEDFYGLFVHPVFTPGLLAGYGTIAGEILADEPETDAIVVPFGVGGLTLGIARALSMLKPGVAVYACEPETASPYRAALTSGAPKVVERRSSFIDAIGTPEVLPEVFEEARLLGIRSLVVSVPEAISSLRDLAVRHGLVCEGAATAALAGAKRLARTANHRRIVAVLSGGNIDPGTWLSLQMKPQHAQRRVSI